MDHAEKAVGQLVVAGGNGPADLEMAKHALDAVAQLVERPIILDLYASVRATGDYGLDLPFGKVDTDRVGIIALVCE
ncbi:UNVERIFIED_ORG: hypothetical protein GGD58_001378 [Rhizobium pisi]